MSNNCCERIFILLATGYTNSTHTPLFLHVQKWDARTVLSMSPQGYQNAFVNISNSCLIYSIAQISEAVLFRDSSSFFPLYYPTPCSKGDNIYKERERQKKRNRDHQSYKKKRFKWGRVKAGDCKGERDGEEKKKKKSRKDLSIVGTYRMVLQGLFVFPPGFCRAVRSSLEGCQYNFQLPSSPRDTILKTD